MAEDLIFHPACMVSTCNFVYFCMGLLDNSPFTSFKIGTSGCNIKSTMEVQIDRGGIDD